MKEYILYWIYKALSHLFYFIGDVAWRIDTYFTYEIYQRAMDASIFFDEKNGWEIWKDCSQHNYNG